MIESELVNAIDLDLGPGKTADFDCTVGLGLMATAITDRVLGRDAARRRLAPSRR